MVGRQLSMETKMPISKYEKYDFNLIFTLILWKILIRMFNHMLTELYSQYELFQVVIILL